MTFYFLMRLIDGAKLGKSFKNRHGNPPFLYGFVPTVGQGAFRPSSKADGGHVLLRFSEVFHELPHDVSGGTYGIYGRCDLSDFEFALFSVPSKIPRLEAALPKMSRSSSELAPRASASATLSNSPFRTRRVGDSF